jgi:nitroreductase
MNVSEAVASRRSIRSFSDQPVDQDVIRRVLEKASRSPSGGNVQPWRFYVLNNDAMDRFKQSAQDALMSGKPQAVEYDIYPPKLQEPYRSSRFKCGEDMYKLLEIKREDKPARLNWLTNNYKFFGAPAGLFCFIDRGMGAPQWSDLGMILQTIMLLFQEEGIDTCAQEAWSQMASTVHEFVEPPENLMLFCGMAIGYRDEAAAVNKLVTDRAPLEDWVTFLS